MPIMAGSSDTNANDTSEVEEDTEKQRSITVPGGYVISDPGPVVIVGPNGSGKTRLSRQITSAVGLEVVNSLRNTRISQQLQPMSLGQAKANFVSQREQARVQPYELSNDFDFLLTSLFAESFNTSTEYLQSVRAGRAESLPELTTLEKVQSIWSRFFPGRELFFKDYGPYVRSSVLAGADPVEYTAWQMSDGEKAALYLAGRLINADERAVVLVDEPETHFHSLLAVEFWDAIEAERPDLRIVYVTHDMTFASSRRGHVLLASPATGLTPSSFQERLSDDVAAVLLGTASLSFYAKRVIFCEGDENSFDKILYAAWLGDRTTVVRPVGSADMVIRCVTALRRSNLIRNLEVVGLVDRDFHPDNYFAALPQGVYALGVHEVESIFAVPAVAVAVGSHIGNHVDEAQLCATLISSYQDHERSKVILERWKRQVESRLVGVVATVGTRNAAISEISSQIPATFDSANWDFKPQEILETERTRVEEAFINAKASIVEVLRLMPGKQLIPRVAQIAGMTPQAYRRLIVAALEGDSSLADLESSIRSSLSEFLPEFARPDAPRIRRDA
ncbi:ATP-dependent nuclease [Micromonospora aurantiaca (nom. illeg.)]|uniref:ATP-dependent nuclease n=1 Tax=Micromonospora aurantiaca (nom. illeg.) TaxID=47850 RepID=UPI00364CFC9D